MKLIFEHFDYKRNLEKQRDLFKDCFPETNGETIQEARHYFWKFHQFPSKIKSWEYTCYYNEDMVGYYAAIPYRYKIGEKKTPVGMVCDVMTNSKYRGQGIFTKTGHYSTNELSAYVPFVTGYPIRKEVIPGHLKVGWKIAFQLPLYIKFLRFNALFHAKGIAFLAPLANAIISGYNFFTRTKVDLSYSCNIVDTVDEIIGYEEFTEKWNRTVPNALIKDPAFVRWRYSAPERKYHFLTIRNATQQLVAFVAFRKIIRENVPSYGILDYQALPEYDNCHGLINSALRKKAKHEKVEAIITMMSKYSARKYRLINNGFLKSFYTFSLIIKNLTNEFSDAELFEEKNWHLMWVDSDDL